MAFKLKCPHCRKAFPWDTTQGMPEFCALCGEKVGHDREDDDVVMPFLRTSSKMKAIDNVYRDMEAGSIRRAEMAASMFGESAADTGLKITNMKDNQKPGDLAIDVPSNPVSDLMTAAPDHSGYNLASMGPYFSQNVSQGYEPNAGLKTMGPLKRLHAEGGGPTSDVMTKEIYDRGPRRIR